MSPQPRSATLAGIGLMVLGIFLFCCNDALGKWLLGTYSVWQMLVIRSFAAMLILSPFLWHEGRAVLAAPRPWLQIVRVMLSTLESIMFFIAVTYLPLADTVTFYLAAPIYVTALSAMFLEEQVGWRRWSAVVVGFVGVMIALRPSAATLTLPALIAIVGSFFFAIFLIITRMLRGTSDVVMVSGQFRLDADRRRRRRAVWLDHAERGRLRSDDGARRGRDDGVRLRQPLAQARARERRWCRISTR